MTGRKTLLEKVRERALAIHQRNGCLGVEKPGFLCLGPTDEEREQAAREVLGNERKPA